MMTIRPDAGTRVLYTVGGRLGIIGWSTLALFMLGFLALLRSAAPTGTVGGALFIAVTATARFVWRYIDSSTFCLVVSDVGVEDRYGRTRRLFDWNEVSLLAWDSGYAPGSLRSTFAPCIVLCLSGDRRPVRALGGVVADRAAAISCLKGLGAAGWPVDVRQFPASTWWEGKAS